MATYRLAECVMHPGSPCTPGFQEWCRSCGSAEIDGAISLTTGKTGTVEGVRQLNDMGFQIIVLSSRAGRRRAGITGI